MTGRQYQAVKQLNGRSGMISAYGNWYEIRAKGIGVIQIRELYPYAAIEEAALRWDMDPETLEKLCTVREAEE